MELAVYLVVAEEGVVEISSAFDSHYWDPFAFDSSEEECSLAVVAAEGEEEMRVEVYHSYFALER